MAYLVASAFLCRRMMPASARNESFTVLALGNALATSGLACRSCVTVDCYARGRNLTKVDTIATCPCVYRGIN